MAALTSSSLEQGHAKDLPLKVRDGRIDLVLIRDGYEGERVLSLEDHFLKMPNDSAENMYRSNLAGHAKSQETDKIDPLQSVAVFHVGGQSRAPQEDRGNGVYSAGGA